MSHPNLSELIMTCVSRITATAARQRDPIKSSDLLISLISFREVWEQARPRFHDPFEKNCDFLGGTRSCNNRGHFVIALAQADASFARERWTKRKSRSLQG